MSEIEALAVEIAKAEKEYRRLDKEVSAAIGKSREAFSKLCRLQEMMNRMADALPPAARPR
jgi:hypothetical protein